MFFSRRNKSIPQCVQEYLDAPRPKEDAHWREIPYTALDIETSGLNPKRDVVLSVGTVNIEQGRIQMGQRWYSMMRPPDVNEVGAASISIHGLLREELSQAPPTEEVLLELIRRIHGRVLIVHVSAIDVQFLDRAMRSYFGVKMRGPVLDTARLSGTLNYNELFIGGYDDAPRDVTLRGLSQKANLPVYSEHDALGDAITTAQLFLSQVTRLQKQGIETFQKLFRAGGSLK